MKNRLSNPGLPSDHGQILVLAALMMVLLIAITGLAIDISAAYMADRWQRAVADEAALAGGQDLQVYGSRSLPSDPLQLAAMYASAEDHAMDVLVAQLHATSKPSAAACFNATGCALPGTRYEVSVQAPSPSCVDCNPARAIQVSVRQPSFGLTFARIFGQDHWTVVSTSVAGIVIQRQYGLVTLRPPRLRGSGTQNTDNISITGGSQVIVGGADVATNTNLTCDGAASGSALHLEAGFSVFHWDINEAWISPPDECAPPLPYGEQLTSPLEDPAYDIPQKNDLSAGCPTNDVQICTYADPNLDDAKLPVADCDTVVAGMPSQYNVVAADATCYMPGIYTKELNDNRNTDFSILTPGVYFFEAGLDISGSLIGGYDAAPGVAIVLPYCAGLNCPAFTANNAVLVALNLGTAYLNTTGAGATAAEWDGGLVETSTDPPHLMTLMVEPDPSCLAAPFPYDEPTNTCTNRQPQIKLPGGGHLAVAGVQYAPTDNTTVTGSSPQQGVLGQIISWTITFNGNSTLNLEAFIVDDLGVLRLDPACSPTVPTCNP